MTKKSKRCTATESSCRCTRKRGHAGKWHRCESFCGGQWRISKKGNLKVKNYPSGGNPLGALIGLLDPFGPLGFPFGRLRAPEFSRLLPPNMERETSTDVN